MAEKYLIFAEDQTMLRIAMTMQDWIKKLDVFLMLNDRDILTHPGKISHNMAKQQAEQEYDQFHAQRLQALSASSDPNLMQLSDAAAQISRAKKSPKK